MDMSSSRCYQQFGIDSFIPESHRSFQAHVRKIVPRKLFETPVSCHRQGCGRKVAGAATRVLWRSKPLADEEIEESVRP